MLSYCIYFIAEFILRSFLFPSDVSDYSNSNSFSQVLYFFWSLLYLLFWVTQNTKRCHDLNKNGWWQLLPLFNPFYLLLKGGDLNSNRFGDNPKVAVNSGSVPQSTLASSPFSPAKKSRQSSKSSRAIKIKPSKDLKVGDGFGGGSVCYIFKPGDKGFIADKVHGLIAATADQNTVRVPWSPDSGKGKKISKGTNTAIGFGFVNTGDIIARNGTGVTYAAGMAGECSCEGFSDWHLPSKDELRQLYLHKDAIGGFDNGFYWSSSEISGFSAWGQSFVDGGQDGFAKSNCGRVRSVRYF